MIISYRIKKNEGYGYRLILKNELGTVTDSVLYGCETLARIAGDRWITEGVAEYLISRNSKRVIVRLETME